MKKLQKAGENDDGISVADSYAKGLFNIKNNLKKMDIQKVAVKLSTHSGDGWIEKADDEDQEFFFDRDLGDEATDNHLNLESHYGGMETPTASQMTGNTFGAFAAMIGLNNRLSGGNEGGKGAGTMDSDDLNNRMGGQSSFGSDSTDTRNADDVDIHITNLGVGPKRDSNVSTSNSTGDEASPTKLTKAGSTFSD